ncbi:MAG: hypothetical protein FD123_2079 [Bacteroidetes bacterium]|nr:MAG: hypothetical protein FD123_2079 [Bacteroidota bacterium]
MSPVAHVHSARTEMTDDNWGEVISKIVLDDQFPEEAFQGISDFSHLEIVFYFHLAPAEEICTGARHPRGNKNWPETGIFAQRGKARPNKIGLCIVELLEHRGRVLYVRGLDAIAGTPVLDIKPVMQEFLPRTKISQPDWSKELMKNYW